ncbi:MAG TPA: hypothetical protein DCM54_14750 [Gammaproteobacteria bacterium]|nr:hypothetical protein [Gammaproteobacteria bacterium]
MAHWSAQAATSPLAKEGLLDLSDWDFSRDGNVNLRGDYEFYWEELLDTSSLLTKTPDTVIYLPKPWVGTIIDSQPEGGEVQITTEESETDDRQLFYDEIPAGSYIVLSVEDNGIRIPTDDLDMVFQPFFSRKEGS